jgi:hypothetical protein
MQLHIIYTEQDMLLSKRRYASWREIQGEYERYKASLGPWSDDQVVEYLTDEYSDLSPSAQEQVSAFLAGPDEVRVLTFRGQRPDA